MTSREEIPLYLSVAAVCTVSFAAGRLYETRRMEELTAAQAVDFRKSLELHKPPVIPWGEVPPRASASRFWHAQYPPTPYRAPYTPPPTVITEFPFFGAHYVGRDDEATPPAKGGDPDVKAQLDRIERKIDRLFKLLEEDPAPDEKGAAGAGDKVPAIVTAANVCFACHGPDTAEKDGAGFVMFVRKPKGDAYDLRPLEGADAARLVRKVRSGEMPPAKAGKLVPDGKDALIAHYLKK